MKNVDFGDMISIALILAVFVGITSCERTNQKLRCIDLTKDFERCSKEFGGFP